MSKNKFSLLVFAMDIVVLCKCLNYNYSREKELYDHLFTNHNKYLLPRYNSSTPVEIVTSMHFEYLDDVDVKRQTFTVNMVFQLYWTDNILTWDSASYTGVDFVTVAYDMLWTPELVILGAIGKASDYGQQGTLATIYSNGLVSLRPSKAHTIRCAVDIRKYPFDEQQCDITLALGRQDRETIIVAGHSEIDLSMYMMNGEWQIDVQQVSHFASQHGNVTYTLVTFPFTMRRRWQFIVLNIFFPTICTSLLTMLCFCLPTESGERVGLSISIFLTLAVFMTVASNDLPETAEGVSLIGAYIALQLAWSGTTIVLTVLSLSLVFKKHDNDIPRWLAMVLQYGQPKLRSVPPIEVTKDTCDESGQTKAIGNVHDEHIAAGNDSHGYSRERDIDISWEYIAGLFNRLCLCCSILWHCGIHAWCIVRIYA